jgi:hypothetical protein
MPSLLFRVAQFAVLAGLSTWACTGPSFAAGPRQAAGGPTLIFITKSDACDCVLNLCVAGEQEVINFLDGEPYGFRLERIDLAEKPEQGKTYRAVTLPVVILEAPEGHLVARFDTFFTANDFHTAWKKHLRAGKSP